MNGRTAKLIRNTVLAAEVKNAKDNGAKMPKLVEYMEHPTNLGRVIQYFTGDPALDAQGPQKLQLPDQRILKPGCTRFARQALKKAVKRGLPRVALQAKVAQTLGQAQPAT